MKNVIGAITIGSVVIGGSMIMATDKVDACDYPEAKVTASVLNIRSGRGTNHSVIGKLKRGETVYVTELKAEGGFIKIAKGSTVGYVSVDYLSAEGCNNNNSNNNDDEYIYNDEYLNNKDLLLEPYKTRVTANVNFRKTKEINNSNKIGLIRNYSEVLVLGASQDGKWARVQYRGQEGYVSSQYIAPKK